MNKIIKNILTVMALIVGAGTPCSCTNNLVITPDCRLYVESSSLDTDLIASYLGSAWEQIYHHMFGQELPSESNHKKTL